MKKCVCISCFDNYENRMRKIIEFFEKNNCDTIYLYADYNHSTKKENVNIYDCGEKIHVRKYNKNISLKRLYSHYIFAKKVRKRIETIKPDVIYCMIPPNYLVKELSDYKQIHPNIKLIYDVYDMWPESFPYVEKINALKFPFAIWKGLRSSNISKADLVLCVSEQEKEALIKELDSTPVRVLKPMIPIGEIPQYHPSAEKFSFCYLGMINHIIDIDLGVCILGELAKNKPTVLHIVGEGQNLDEFVEKLKEKKVEVICHGCVFDLKKKNKIFEMCNMGLNIPRKEINSTMSLKAIEYLRAGLPFINNANGDIRIIIEEDGGGLNYKGDVVNLIKEIVSLNVETYNEMHNKCVYSYRKRFLAQDYDEIIGSVLGWEYG